MASPVGDLVVRIGADLTELQKGVQKAQGHLSKLGASMRTGINIAGKYAAAMAAAGAAVTATLVTKAMGAIDAQAKLARQIGTTTVGLQSLQKAAELSGVSNEKLRAGLNAMTRRLGEAANGVQSYKKFVDDLGLSAEHLIQLDSAEAFGEISEAISRLPTAAQRSAAAMNLFSDAGRDMVNLFAGGKTAIDEARAEIEALGVAVSDVDASTIERANDAMSSLRDVFRGAINRITVKLAPFIEAVATALRNAAIESRGFESQINAAFSGAMKAVGFFGNVVHGIKGVFKGVELVVYGFGSVVASVIEIATKAIFKFATEVNKSINFIIKGMNKIPKVEIPFLETDMDQFGAVQFVTTLGNAMRDKVGEIRGELHDFAMQELPSTKIERFLSNVSAAAAEASESANRLRNELTGGDVEGEETDQAEEEVDRYRETLSRKLETLRESLLAEAELEKERFAEKLDMLDQAEALGLEMRGGYQAAREQLEQEHQDRLTEIERKGLTERQRFEQASMKQKTKTVLGELQNLSAGIANHNKAAFQANKIAGIANAIINAHEGISKTMSAYPYPINVGMAAAHAAAAFAQVSAIKNASFGGGFAPSLAGSTPATPVTPVTSGTPGGVPASRRIAVEGFGLNDLLTGRQVRDLIEMLNEAGGDGAQIVFAG